VFVCNKMSWPAALADLPLFLGVADGSGTAHISDQRDAA